MDTQIDRLADSSTHTHTPIPNICLWGHNNSCPDIDQEHHCGILSHGLQSAMSRLTTKFKVNPLSTLIFKLFS